MFLLNTIHDGVRNPVVASIERPIIYRIQDTFNFSTRLIDSKFLCNREEIDSPNGLTLSIYTQLMLSRVPCPVGEGQVIRRGKTPQRIVRGL